MQTKKDKDLARLAAWNSMTPVAIAAPSPALPMPTVVAAKPVVKNTSQSVNHNDQPSATINTEEALCATCLEESSKETPTTFEHDGFMYCMEHLPPLD